MFGTVMLASSLAALVTTLGIFVISRYGKWASENAVFFMSFAAGVLVTISFLHLIPDALGESSSAPLYLLVGFLLLHLSRRLLNTYLLHEHEESQAVFGLIPLIGIGFHSLVDGMIFSVTFSASLFTGILAAIGMTLHEFPEGIVTYVFLREGGFSIRKSRLYAFLAAALTTPLGALISFPFIRGINPAALANLLALSAGALIYVGATHLLPAVERQHKRYSVVSLMVGVITAVLVILLRN